MGPLLETIINYYQVVQKQMVLMVQRHKPEEYFTKKITHLIFVPTAHL